jgi:serine/threonine-protein kinase
VRSVNESEVYRFITKPLDIRELPRLIGEAAAVARSTPPEAASSGSLPTLEPRKLTAVQQRVTTIAVHPSESILLIDDSREMHAAVKHELGAAVPVQHAYNLLDAVKILKARPVSVIVSEVQVGKIDAIRLVRLMKSKYPEMVSVVFGAQKDAQTVMTLINEGQVFRFIPKPFKPGFIKVVLNAALQRHRILATNPGLQRRFAVQPPETQPA